MAVLGIDLDRPLGTSEFRATYGGFFLSLGIGCIVAQSVQVFTIVGAAWCSAAIVRMVSCAVDNVWTWRPSQNGATDSADVAIF